MKLERKKEAKLTAKRLEDFIEKMNKEFCPNNTTSTALFKNQNKGRR
jgi:hypothetical protein